MKICWDNMEGICLTKSGNFRKGTTIYIYKKSCENCGLPYLTIKHRPSRFCCISCTNKHRKAHNYTDLTGYRFGRLTVIYDAGRYRSKQSMWKCICDCGNEKIVRACDLKRERTKSCGCLSREITSKMFKGKSKSEKQKRKQSKIMYGRKSSEEARKKISKSLKGMFSGYKNPMYGKKTPTVVKKKISKKLKGRFAGKNNPMYGRCGSDHPNWKGGVSCEPYCQLWRDKEYKTSILERDNYKCQNPNCWGKEGISTQLMLHHINYEKKDCRPINLITLCRSCNARANFNRNKWEKFYHKIMKEKNLYYGKKF